MVAMAIHDRNGETPPDALAGLALLFFLFFAMDAYELMKKGKGK